MRPPIREKTPFFIWITAYLLMQSASLISILFLYTPGVADVYLTYSVGLVLIYWLGSKVLILTFINAFINSYFWGHATILSWSVFAFTESVFFFLSWLLYIRIGKNRFWISNLNDLVKFLIMGIVIPLTVLLIMIKYLLAFYGELDPAEIWGSILGSWLGDFMPTIILTLPILFFLSGPFHRRMNWHQYDIPHISPPVSWKPYIEFFVLIGAIVILSLNADFTKYWYIYGLISLVSAVRFGFGATLLVNLFILLLIYLVPALVFNQRTNLYFDQNQLLEIYLGINLLALFSIICGRVISDFGLAQKSLLVQMDRVEKINAELDRFVYSVSHDLVAPLKSIMGLTNLMKKDPEKEHIGEYIERIEESAHKLNDFIAEILDYSRTTRAEIEKTTIDLVQLINENLSNHRYLPGFQNFNFDMEHLNAKVITADKTRLKIILNNLISNAIKFSQVTDRPMIKFSSWFQNGEIIIVVEDNGPGIPEDVQEKIFEMFYRARPDSPGSGLGLFIAREAAQKLNGELTVISNEGSGSKFLLRLPG